MKTVDQMAKNANYQAAKAVHKQTA